MLERFKKCISFIFRQPILYIFAIIVVFLCLSIGCQGLMNVNGHDNNVVVEDSFEGGNK